MTFDKTSARCVCVTFALIIGASITSAPAEAGFLDQLFGGGFQTPQPAPDPGGFIYNQSSPVETAPLAPKRRSRKVAATDRPMLQKTTDIMSDKTLRPGDAVMMKSGVHIFDGDADGHHDTGDFISLDSARNVSKVEKRQLVAMDVSRHDPIDYAAGAAVMEGRSVGERPISVGYKITDVRGRSIRYVGP